MGVNNQPKSKYVRDSYNTLCEATVRTRHGASYGLDVNRQEGMSSDDLHKTRSSDECITVTEQKNDMHAESVCCDFEDLLKNTSVKYVQKNSREFIVDSTSCQSSCTTEHLVQVPDHHQSVEVTNTTCFVDVHQNTKNTSCKTTTPSLDFGKDATTFCKDCGKQNEIEHQKRNLKDENSLVGFETIHHSDNNKVKNETNGGKENTKHEKNPIESLGHTNDKKQKKRYRASMLASFLTALTLFRINGASCDWGRNCKEQDKNHTRFSKKDDFEWPRILQGNRHRNKTKSKYQRSNKNKKGKCKSKKHFFKVPKWLTVFRSKRYLPLHLYPANRNSFNSLFNSLSSSQIPSNDMQFEWLRIRSFASYSGSASPIVLSRSGFYFTGNEQGTKCFSCGVTYNQWTQHDNVSRVHRQISPHCRHLLGNDERNVSIGHRDTAMNNSTRNGTHSENEMTINESVDESQTISNRNQSHGGMSETNTTASAEVNSSMIPTSNHEAAAQHSTSSPLPTPNPDSTLDSAPPQASGVSRASVNKLSPLGVNFDKPRYPQFAIPSVRVGTYNGWSATQTPKQMSEAGFVYAGYADYARCFFCGGGLRNWDQGDDPWIEHARWFPRCAFVRQNKGQRFIELVHKQVEGQKQDGRPLATVAVLNRSDLGATAQQSSIKDLHLLPCYQSVRELGYSSDFIESAVHQLILQGKTDFNSRDILGTIFLMEERDTTVITSSATLAETKMDSTDDIGNGDMEEALKLLEENKRLRELAMCIFCREKNSTVSFLPCGHLVCCEDCAPAMKNCPQCNDIIRGTVKTFLV